MVKNTTNSNARGVVGMNSFAFFFFSTYMSRFYFEGAIIMDYSEYLMNNEVVLAGVLEANFIEPTHDKQDFEKTSLFQRLEDRLKQMTLEYW